MGSCSGKKKVAAVKILGTFIAPTFLVFAQMYNAFTLKHISYQGTFDAPVVPNIISKHERDPSLFDPILPLAKNESFGSCLMIKEDNDLLYEWLSYHYTTLPLRYVFIGSDEGNQQNPEEVLKRWKVANTGLEYWIFNASSFMNRHGQSSAKDAHHAFVHRQQAFISTCTEFMKAQGLHWVIYTDSDEFLVMNRLGKGENQTSMESHEVFKLRQMLPPIDSNATFLDAIVEFNKIQNQSPCITTPRILVGALENVTCAGSQDVLELAKSSFRYEEMSTLRFNQHAKKGDFSLNKFGKVMMDVSNISDATIAKGPRNPHRPYKPECRPGALGFTDAIFHIHHYIASFERYSSRQDDRRNRQEWEKRAYITTANSCDQAIHLWFPRFIDNVGINRAKFLLGVEDNVTMH